MKCFICRYRITCVVLTLSLSLPLSAASGLQTVSTPFPLLVSSHMRWSDPVSAQVWGLPLQYAYFESDWSLKQLGMELSRDARYFQVLTRLPGQWLLSGQWAGQHWVAQIMPRSHGRGSQGMVSRWQISAPSLDADSVLSHIFSDLHWGTPLLHVSSTESDKRVEHAIFKMSAQRPDAAQKLTQTLEREGWQRQPDVFASSVKIWQLGHRQLRWQAFAQEVGLMVFIQYQEQG